jgi:hypothetical protein
MMPNNTPIRALTLAGLVLIVAALAFMALCSSPDRSDSVDPTRSALIQIAERGRLTLDLKSLSPIAPLRISLALTEGKGPMEARGVRIISVDGRRLDVVGHPSSHEVPGLDIQIDRSFIQAGSYMLELDTAESHPLNFRRYVLIVR